MPTETKIIRDFIYMDIDRLNSLYSQAFGGVVPQIIKSKSNQGTDTKRQKGIPEENQQELLAEHLVTEARHESKNVILYDYLYTQLEEGIAQSILKPEGLTQDNYGSLLKDAFLIRVQGPAEIEDYQRFTHSAEHFSELTSDVAWVSNSGAAKTLVCLMESQVEELHQQAKNSAGGERSRINSQIADIQRKLKEYEGPEKLKKKLVAQMGWGIDPTFMESITSRLSW